MNINETISEVLRLDAQAAQGPWEPFAGSVVREGETAYLVHGGPDTDAALVAYYRTAAPALAREVQMLQAEVREARIGHDCAIVAAYESGHRAGQEAMREMAATLCDDWEEDSYCEGWREMEQGAQHCADAIRALEVSHD
jgi:hypothetical protein